MGKFCGIIPALLTLFSQDGAKVNLEATGELADLLIKRGVNGLFMAGTTGEGPLMSLQERKVLAEFMVKRVGGRVPLIVHTGCASAPETVELTKHARHIGADAAGVVTPYYYNFDQRALRQYHSRIARATPDFPQLLYNIPGLTNNELTPGLVEKLVRRHENIVGIKDSSGSLEQLRQYRRIPRDDLAVICGMDSLVVDALELGADGNVSSTANVVPHFFVKIHENFRKGNVRAARRWQDRIVELGKLLWTPNYIPAMKEMLRLLGLPTGGSRSPLRKLTAGECRALEQGLRALKIIS
jgi:4-hydroxy-tetrahydrodipicolinate synthase